ncbi:protein of unknown function [Thermomonospora echinospora]|uniref:DUF397 domain-containing protein n=1 Tax=Thermomonospora echinospora TaxID=1992 RepID=A0A1H5XW42_9ACTN|nr:DUF397 domain-containing protein [Thermomonospora echinospora]SEG15667.1 protein of unknown function [Thermomonospora echinospora]
MVPSSRFGRLVWRKSSYSQGLDQNCVELARAGEAVGVRDSKDPDGPRLIFTAAELRSFAAALRAGRHRLS